MGEGFNPNAEETARLFAAREARAGRGESLYTTVMGVQEIKNAQSALEGIKGFEQRHPWYRKAQVTEEDKQAIHALEMTGAVASAYAQADYETEITHVAGPHQKAEIQKEHEPVFHEPVKVPTGERGNKREAFKAIDVVQALAEVENRIYD